MLRSKAANVWRGLLSMSDVAALSNRSPKKWIETSLEQGDFRASLWGRWYSSGGRHVKSSNTFHHRSAPSEQKRVVRRRMNEQITSRTVRLVSDAGALNYLPVL